MEKMDSNYTDIAEELADQTTKKKHTSMQLNVYHDLELKEKTPFVTEEKNWQTNELIKPNNCWIFVLDPYYIAIVLCIMNDGTTFSARLLT